MTTGDIVRERAMELARQDADRSLAEEVLLTACGGRRVAAVRARQQLDARLDSERDQANAMRAMGYIDEVLKRLQV
jgi:hypothetical protein